MAAEEQIVLVDDSGEPIGTAPKLASHHGDTPLHLAFSAYVFNARGNLLLTRRAEAKKVFPGVWTNSCCGHPAPGESIPAAIKRRMKFELGLAPTSMRVALPHYRYRATMNGIVENEICPVYIVESTGEPRINPSEVAEYKWVGWEEFRHLTKSSPRQFSPWSKEQAVILEPIVESMGISSAMEQITGYRKNLAQDIGKLLDKKTPGPSNRWREDVHNRLDLYLSGGKLLRGCLLLFAHEVFGGTNKKSAQSAAASLELLHGALLIHDDIMDQDSTRRGRPAMHSQYAKGSTDRFGESMAICAADAAIFMAMSSLGSLKAPENQKAKLLELFGNVMETVCYGQMLDIELGLSKKPPARQTIAAVMEQKTAVYSLSLPLMAGAILAGQPASVLNKLKELGKLVGTIFQIRDDELGVYGDTSKTGKPVGSDIKEGKKTLLYHYLYKYCSPADKKRLSNIFGNLKASKSDIEFVQSKLKDLKIPAVIDGEVAELTSQASRLIDRLKVDWRHKQTMRQLVAFCAKRDV